MLAVSGTDAVDLVRPLDAKSFVWSSVEFGELCTIAEDDALVLRRGELLLREQVERDREQHDRWPRGRGPPERSVESPARGRGE